MGDSYSTFRIVGTTDAYPKHFDLELAQGVWFEGAMDATLGSRVAEATGLRLGDTFASSHGLDGQGDAHGEQLFKVVGIAKPSGSVADQLILTSLESIWAVHDHADEHEHEHEHEEAPKEVTSALVQFRSPMGLIGIPRQINANTSMQSALPSIEINRLLALMGVGIDTLRLLALVIIIIAGISVFVSLYNSLKERKYEMALMLSMGATRTRLFLMLLFEGLLLALMGYGLGITLSRLGLWILGSAAERDFHYSLTEVALLPEEGYLLVGALLIGTLAAALPSLGVYRLNLSRTLAED
jgi:putative ABC transport system permease protein